MPSELSPWSGKSPRARRQRASVFAISLGFLHNWHPGVVMADLQVPPMLVIVGATASGKSELALELAAGAGAELLSVDSMQIYRDMNIGTAKPSPAERARVRHHLIDLVEPNQEFTVARFVESADHVIVDAQRRGVPLIAAGGTPLYYKALFEGMFEGPGASSEIRERLRNLSSEELHGRLTKADPAAAMRIHRNDTKRLIRALEVHELTGQPISSLQQQWTTPRHRHQAVWIGLGWDREQLNRRINARVKAMLEAGWLDEVRTLLNRYGKLSKTAAEATGYRELIDHVQGRMSLDDAIEQIKIATRQLARRQMKWLRRFPDVHWIDGSLSIDDRLGEVCRWMK
jgi:tRNA dimethylallyltransferase